MADIELVIKIPEGIMEYIKNNDCLAVAYGDEVAKAIRNGTPLPKGHGRLIILSEDAVKREQVSLRFSCQNWISEVGLSNATVAIIEADKESDNEADC